MASKIERRTRYLRARCNSCRGFLKVREIRGFLKVRGIAEGGWVAKGVSCHCKSPNFRFSRPRPGGKARK